MDFQTIVSTLLPYVRYSILIVLIFVTGYLVYRKFFQKKYPLRLATFLSISFLLCWVMTVFALTTSDRPLMYTGQVNMSLFSGYVSAWNKWSLAEFQLIIFNMIMFLPLGMLLPFIHPKYKSFWRVFFISLTFTAGIEVFQLVTGKGIFELDDLFHNTLGSIAGYFLIMVFLLSIEKRKLHWRALGKAFIIPLSFVGIIGLAFIVYETQEYGNIPYTPAVKQKMKDVDIQLETNLYETTSNACIYFNQNIKNLDAARDFSQKVAKQFQLKQQGGMGIDGENRIFYYEDKNGTEYSLNYFMQSGTWSFYEQNREEMSQADIEKQKQLLESWFLEENLLPANAIYQHQHDSTIRWDIPKTNHLDSFCQDFSQGLLIVTLSNNEIPLDITYDIQNNKLIGEEEIISEQQAYKKLQNGEFSLFNPLVPGDALTITEVKLTYSYDTKGYYRPAYAFTGYVNNPENNIEIMIAAME